MLVGRPWAQMGTVATKYVKGYGIRICFGIAVVGCDLSVLMKLISACSPPLNRAMDVAATVLILGLVTCSRYSSS